MWNALLTHACLGLDCHEFSSAPASRASPPSETHAGTPREREREREISRERESSSPHTHKIWPRVWVWVCVCICVYVCVCECVCVCVYFVWACVCDCCHVRTSRGLSDDPSGHRAVSKTPPAMPSARARFSQASRKNTSLSNTPAPAYLSTWSPPPAGRRHSAHTRIRRRAARAREA